MTVQRHRLTLLVLALIAVVGGAIAWPASGTAPGGSEALAGLVGGIGLGLLGGLLGRYRLGVDLPADIASAEPLVPTPSSRPLSFLLGLLAALVVAVLYAVGRSTENPAAVPALLAAGALLSVALPLLSGRRAV